jgi:hypothetical protein
MVGQVAACQHDNSLWDKLDRHIERDRPEADLCRKAVTALTAKMARSSVPRNLALAHHCRRRPGAVAGERDLEAVRLRTSGQD